MERALHKPPAQLPKCNGPRSWPGAGGVMWHVALDQGQARPSEKSQLSESDRESSDGALRQIATVTH